MADSSPLSAVAAQLLARSTVEVRSRTAPPFEVALYAADGRTPAPWVELLRPSLTVKVDGRAVARVAPAGEPEEVAWMVAAAVGVALAVLVLAVLTRR